jgi:hypothetical protein
MNQYLGFTKKSSADSLIKETKTVKKDNDYENNIQSLRMSSK